MTDVLVIGAGPAGAVAAGLLAQRGHKVLVLEKQLFPRFSIGESLLAQSLALIEDAGMLEAVQAGGFQYKNGAAFAWQGKHSDFNFAQKSSPGPGFTYQVIRADFDQILIKEAQRMGAEAHFEVEITAADFSGERPRITARDKGGKVTVHEPKFVLDASGFGRVLPQLLKLISPSNQPSRVAFYTQVYDRIPSGAFDRQKIRITTHPQHRDVWMWLIPFSNGLSSMGVVGTEELLYSRGTTFDERLWSLTNDDPELKALLKDNKPFNPVRELKGYSANVSTMAERGFALLGNAAEFLDPVFSSGVTIALKSAHMAVPLVERTLKGETLDWKNEFEVPLRYGVETFRAFVDTWYDNRLQDIIYYEKQDPKIKRMICSVLAGYAWDRNNPYTGEKALHRLDVLAQTCRRGG
ncbi:MAG: NAD(P)/FAD-dependent oxidoreductase [Stenotrophobium sp.]